ncbi:MAG: hypothetical protein LBM28_05915 [Oscillospiraceae bacterium]|jgi:hypothetical protein|nr:hypothetical protein [Oscillospiraceae bacterium]
MHTRTFFITLGAGVLTGGMVALMLPRHSTVRRKAQHAADTIEESIARVAHRVID